MEEKKVEIRTDLGNIRVKLYNETPKHRDNFLKLVREGFYKDLLFHRVIKDFMIQGGDPKSKGASSETSLGGGDVGYTIPAEMDETLIHKKGALAAARTGDEVNPKRESSGCQFYIVQGKLSNDAELNQTEKYQENKAKERRFKELCLERSEEIRNLQITRNREGLMKLQSEFEDILDKEFKNKKYKYTAEQRETYKTIGGTPFLDREYTVFGEVIDGLDVVDKIASVVTGNADRPKSDLKFEIVEL